MPFWPWNRGGASASPAGSSSSPSQDVGDTEPGSLEAIARSEREDRVVFVTVGTTSFDALIRVVNGEACRAELQRMGYSKLVIQKGRGAFCPDQTAPGDGSLTVTQFDFSPSLATFMASASLVISHAGSGSIFEALRAGKALVVVVNEALMDNHQQELAHALASESYLHCAAPDTLVTVLSALDVTKLRPYPAPETEAYSDHIDGFLGFQ